ncbi:glycosyltransferase family 2 protein [Pseudaminobacter soli (ex Li et al. 2025)]|uniref:glycosyltransferase family 2 protein n=1 Tax=Pseudaminobacter soli (ex Li et al. 2025) TaxID=1295366 RepID=UPI0024768108|nr:glycosyltransferase family A protein [Mesorhizobium soli]
MTVQTRSDQPCDRSDIRAVIFIPAHGQPALTAESLHSAIGQQCDFPFAIVVVNDGCPVPETHEICQNFAASYPGKVFYLSKANKGLSAARNSGLEFSLRAFPALEAVFFLDCDNHISPHLLRRLVHALRAGDSHAGWVYTDVDKFGFASFSDMSGPYSSLEHLFRSFCEAGSMVSRRMLDAGARFDEAMRKGVEDWDFWLQGLSMGFHGIHVPNAGFHYRRRGESMLTETERDIAPILDYIRKKHTSLYSIQAVQEREIKGRVRYAVYHPDTRLVRCMTATSDPSQPVVLEDYLRCLLRAAEKPDYGSCPGHLIVLEQNTYDLLSDMKLLAGVFWILECALQQAASTSCTIDVRTSVDVSLAWTSTDLPRADKLSVPFPSQPVHVWAVEAGALLAEQFPEGGFAFGNHWHTVKPFGSRHFTLEIAAPNVTQMDASPIAPDAFAALSSALEAVAEQGSRSFWHCVPYDRYRTQAAMPRDYYPEFFRLYSSLPVMQAGNAIAFVLDRAEHDDIAKATQLAISVRAHGLVPHLLCFGSTFAGPSADLDVFAEIISMPLPSLDNHSDLIQNYLGTDLPLLDGRDRQAALGTLAAFSKVVSVRGRVLHLLAGALRKLGVRTWAFIEDAKAGASNAAVAGSAFEQAYDAIFPETVDVLHLCRAIGYPAGKLRVWEEHFPPRTITTAMHDFQQTADVFS